MRSFWIVTVGRQNQILLDNPYGLLSEVWFLYFGEKMRIEKVINNNVVSAHDDSHIEIIVMGKGIGFQKKQGDAIEQDRIEKIYRMENKEILGRFEELLAKLPLVHLQVSNDIISYAKKELETELNQNIYITLTDHINFALVRFQEGNIFHNALVNEVKMFYPKEYEIGMFGLKLIENKTNVKLPEDEAASIALHIVNAEFNTKMRDIWGVTNLIQSIMDIVDEELRLKPGEENTPREEFITNLKFLGKRILLEPNKKDKSDALIDFVRQQYPKEYACVVKIAEFVKKQYECTITEEEKAYLVLDLRKMTNSYNTDE